MKRLLLLSTLTLLTLSAGGCGGRMWNWWHRGSPCGTYEQNYSYNPCETTPLAHGALLPPTTSGTYISPGPVETLPRP